MKIITYMLIGIPAFICWCLLGMFGVHLSYLIVKYTSAKYDYVNLILRKDRKFIRLLILILGPIGLILSILYCFICIFIHFVMEGNGEQ